MYDLMMIEIRDRRPIAPADRHQPADRLLDRLLGRGTLLLAADRLRCVGAGCVMRDIRECGGSRPCWPSRYRLPREGQLWLASR